MELALDWTERSGSFSPQRAPMPAGSAAMLRCLRDGSLRRRMGMGALTTAAWDGQSVGLWCEHCVAPRPSSPASGSCSSRPSSSSRRHCDALLHQLHQSINRGSANNQSIAASRTTNQLRLRNQSILHAYVHPIDGFVNTRLRVHSRFRDSGFDGLRLRTINTCGFAWQNGRLSKH